jgi:uncharacterized protein
MGATLDALHRLQEIELQIADIRSGIDRKARAVTRQQARIQALDAKITALIAAIRHDQIEADRFDLDVKSQEAEIAKLRQALNAVKTNKEYSAILTQLNTNKADNSKIEEKVLVALTQIDVKKKELAGLQEEKAGEVTKQGEFQAAVKQTEEHAKPKLDRLLAERAKAAESVPAAALQVFNRVANKNEGQALAVVMRTNPKRAEYACGGCNMAINIEQVNAIMSRDEAVLCNSCGRILYLEQPTVGAR